MSNTNKSTMSTSNNNSSAKSSNNSISNSNSSTTSNMHSSERTERLAEYLKIQPNSRLVEELEEENPIMNYIFQRLLNDELRNMYKPPGMPYKTDAIKRKILRDYKEFKENQQESQQEAGGTSTTSSVNKQHELQQKITATEALLAQQRQELMQLQQKDQAQAGGTSNGESPSSSPSNETPSMQPPIENNGSNHVVGGISDQGLSGSASASVSFAFPPSVSYDGRNIYNNFNFDIGAGRVVWNAGVVAQISEAVSNAGVLAHISEAVSKGMANFQQQQQQRQKSNQQQTNFATDGCRDDVSNCASNGTRMSGGSPSLSPFVPNQNDTTTFQQFVQQWVQTQQQQQQQQMLQLRHNNGNIPVGEPQQQQHVEPEGTTNAASTTVNSVDGGGTRTLSSRPSVLAAATSQTAATSANESLDMHLMQQDTNSKEQQPALNYRTAESSSNAIGGGGDDNEQRGQQQQQQEEELSEHDMLLDVQKNQSTTKSSNTTHSTAVDGTGTRTVRENSPSGLGRGLSINREDTTIADLEGGEASSIRSVSASGMQPSTRNIDDSANAVDIGKDVDDDVGRITSQPRSPSVSAVSVNESPGLRSTSDSAPCSSAADSDDDTHRVTKTPSVSTTAVEENSLVVGGRRNSDMANNVAVSKDLTGRKRKHDDDGDDDDTANPFADTTEPTNLSGNKTTEQVEEQVEAHVEVQVEAVIPAAKGGESTSVQADHTAASTANRTRRSTKSPSATSLMNGYIDLVANLGCALKETTLSRSDLRKVKTDTKCSIDLRSLKINWKTGSPSGCHRHHDKGSGCGCSKRDRRRGNIFHGELISSQPQQLQALLEKLAQDTRRDIDDWPIRLREERYVDPYNKQPQLPHLPFKKVEVIDMDVLNRLEHDGLKDVKVLEHTKSGRSIEDVKDDFMKLKSAEWKYIMSLLQTIPFSENCGSGDLHLTYSAPSKDSLVHAFPGHVDKGNFDYVIFLPLIGEFWTLVAVPSDSPDAMEPDDGLDEMRKDFEGGVFQFDTTRGGGSDLDTYVEGFKKDAEERMNEKDVVVKFFRCTRGVVLKFPARIYFHGTVSLPSVNKTGRLLAAFVQVTGDGITEEN